MNLQTIRIEGNIFSPEVLEKLDQKNMRGQTPKDFGFAKGLKIKDEVANAWAEAQSLWQMFKRRRERLSERQLGTSETQTWIRSLLETLLGYHLQEANPETINERAYPISHREAQHGAFPVHILSFKRSLDEKPGYGTGELRMSPHALVQEYLNITEHLYALVTNGLQLRVLRDSSRLVRLTFQEFDLEQMMEEGHFADFVVMYRLLHVSRLPKNLSEAATSWLEQYHQDSLEAGTRIREGLSKAVEQSIITLANGFLRHPDNQEGLVAALNTEALSEEKFYQNLLRLVYRLLFLMVIEERQLVYAKIPLAQDETDEQALERKKYNWLRQVYYQYYSVQRLRRLCEKRYIADERHQDLWMGLKYCFRLYESAPQGSALGICPLNGKLFGKEAIESLDQAQLDNHTLLTCMRSLSIFYNPITKQSSRVNYGALNVEEFGSVYEGLLDYKPRLVPAPLQDLSQSYRPKFEFIKGKERASSGAHYTPEELVKPLIQHSLDHIIEDRLKQANPEAALLGIKVCDVACGSGHVLLAAARRIGHELARHRTNEDQPAPPAMRQAIRDVIRHCIYGVDINPLAVELCKVALWLEAHTPGEPLNFLDHKIRCGDAIVGLAHKEELETGIATEAFKKLKGDDATFATRLRTANKAERKTRQQTSILHDNAHINEPLANIRTLFARFNRLPESTPADIHAKEKEHIQLMSGAHYLRLKQLADAQVAQFFLPKQEGNELMTDAEYFAFLRGKKAMQSRQLAQATAIAEERRFFHWFLEFPEVFAQGGFDCILGNPPFLGGQKLSTNYGHSYLNWLHTIYAPAKGTTDLVAYFFRRIYNIIKPKAFQALISTNTIAQGDTREGGLEVIVQQGGSVNFAVRSQQWPGMATVSISLVNVYKGAWTKGFRLSDREVDQINSYLDDAIPLGAPLTLQQNTNKGFIGSYVLGQGFILTSDEAQKLIDQNPKNKEVLFPFINGQDLNRRPDQSASRWIINFFDYPLRRMTDVEWKKKAKKEQQEIKTRREKSKVILLAPPDYKKTVAMDYPEPLAIVENLVKPERQRTKIDAKGNEVYVVRSPMPERWWQYGEKRPLLYQTIKPLKQVLVITIVSKTHALVFSNPEQVFSHATAVFAFQQYSKFLTLQSSLHEHWAWKYSSSMKGDRRYAPSDCFETFPFPQEISSEQEERLEALGKQYYECRRLLMLDIQLGLTKTYNQFHNENLRKLEEGDEALPKKEFEKKYGKASWNLHRHLSKTAGTIDYNQTVSRVNDLRRLHQQMDELVLQTYGWQHIQLQHDFREVDYLPENDRVRYTISPEARKQVLQELLLLNHHIHAQEQEAEAKAVLATGGKKSTTKKTDASAEPTPKGGQLGLF